MAATGQKVAEVAMQRLLTAISAGIAVAAVSAVASAADWTSPGPIKILIAFEAGGGADPP